MLNRSAIASKGLNSLEIDALELTAVPVDMTKDGTENPALGRFGRRKAIGKGVGPTSKGPAGAPTWKCEG